MWINPSDVIRNLDGTPAMVGPDRHMTFGEVICAALLMPAQQGEQLSATEQIRRGKLAQSLHGAISPVQVCVEDAALIKQLVAKRGVPLITMQIAEAIDNPPLPLIREAV